MMLTCQEVTELVTDYMERRMPFGQRVSFAMHIALCPHCRRYLKQLRTTVRTLGRLPADFSLPSDVEEQLLAQFRRLQPPRAPRSSSRLRLLAAFDKYFGRRRGAVLVTGAVLGLAALSVAFGEHEDGFTRDLECSVLEPGIFLAYGLVAALLLRSIAGSCAVTLSAASYASFTLLSALPWYGVTMLRCPLAGVVSHALVFHVGSLLAASLLAAAVGRGGARSH